MSVNHRSFSCPQKDDRYDFQEANPFVQEDEEVEVASVGYRYKYQHQLTSLLILRPQLKLTSPKDSLSG